ncbi:Protein of unknown function [Cotesia congregata]|uniref:Uncharacterized protein n=1 Tax=Cotesia congregata TaxID=51543 RepID=A0A8J2H8Y9_COTCN|nr:Protein of unknown function [Cotesia congregata]
MFANNKFLRFMIDYTRVTEDSLTTQDFPTISISATDENFDYTMFNFPENDLNSDDSSATNFEQEIASQITSLMKRKTCSECKSQLFGDGNLMNRINEYIKSAGQVFERQIIPLFHTKDIYVHFEMLITLLISPTRFTCKHHQNNLFKSITHNIMTLFFRKECSRRNRVFKVNEETSASARKIGQQTGRSK